MGVDFLQFLFEDFEQIVVHFLDRLVYSINALHDSLFVLVEGLHLALEVFLFARDFAQLRENDAVFLCEEIARFGDESIQSSQQLFSPLVFQLRLFFQVQQQYLFLEIFLQN